MGLLLGLVAVVLWSSMASLVFLAGNGLGLWQFLCLASLFGGLTQLAIHVAWKREIRSCVVFPITVWATLLFGFVMYNLVYTMAFQFSTSHAQVRAVNLTHYAWPAAMVLCAIWWVPGTRVTPQLLAGLAVSILGLGIVNANELKTLFPFFHHDQNSLSVDAIPYVLSGIAAVIWAVYSSLLARWAAWNRKYFPMPMGFAVISIVAGLMSGRTGQWRMLNGQDWGTVFLCGLGPFGNGYLLWELALRRTSAGILGIIAAATPVLSTLLLCLVQGEAPDKKLLVGAGLMSVAMLLASLHTQSKSPQ